MVTSFAWRWSQPTTGPVWAGRGGTLWIAEVFHRWRELGLLVADVPWGVAGAVPRCGDAARSDEADDSAPVAGEGLEDLEHGVVAVDRLAGQGVGDGGRQV